MANKALITMDDIARLAKVSKPTVSRALSDSPLVKSKTKEHVLAIARQHGYAVNRNAQKLRHKRTNTIAVSIDFLSHRKNHISDPFIFELLAGVAEALGDFNQDLLLCAPHNNNADFLQDIINSRGADGFIFLGQGHRESMLNQLAASGAPLVVWGAQSPDTHYCVVGSDNFLGGQLAGQHFIRQKKLQTVFLGDPSFGEMNLRYKGLEDALKHTGKAYSLNSITIEEFSYESALAVFEHYMQTTQTPPNAVFAWGDTAAMATIKVLSDLGYKVPEDISVVGYNDIPTASYFSPGITTIRQDTHQAGQLLAQKLMDILEGETPSSTMIDTSFIERHT